MTDLTRRSAFYAWIAGAVVALDQLAKALVDRYLEHARALYFENGGRPEYYLSSADWMPRNLDRRVEIAFPILDPALQAAVKAVLDEAQKKLPPGVTLTLSRDKSVYVQENVNQLVNDVATAEVLGTGPEAAPRVVEVLKQLGLVAP